MIKLIIFSKFPSSNLFFLNYYLNNNEYFNNSSVTSPSSDILLLFRVFLPLLLRLLLLLFPRLSLLLLLQVLHSLLRPIHKRPPLYIVPLLFIIRLLGLLEVNREPHVGRVFYLGFWWFKLSREGYRMIGEGDTEPVHHPNWSPQRKGEPWYLPRRS